MKVDRFKRGDEIEYTVGTFSKLGGHWFRCRVDTLDVKGRPHLLVVKDGKGEWMSEPVQYPATAKIRFRAIPTRPYFIRRREPHVYRSGLRRYQYFVQISGPFFAVQIGSMREAYRFATEREAKTALRQLRRASAGDWLALSLETVKRDEDALEDEDRTFGVES